jgi:hypothetical protein
VSRIDDAFAKVVGRPPAEHERARLERLRDALGLQDNDAFWAIVMALEHYDSFFRRYPRELAEEAARTIESARAAFAVAAAKEAALAQRRLAEQVAQTSVEIARRLAARPVGLHRVTLVLASVVAFGALCVAAGYGWAAANRPFWVGSDGEFQGGRRLLSIVLNVPAGWMVFALLVPAAAYGARYGWRTASDANLPAHERAIGWSTVGLCVAASVACLVMLARVTG